MTDYAPTACTHTFDPATTVITNERGQAVPTGTVPVDACAFGPQEATTVTWLGGAGLLINARGTRIMIDPLLEGFDMPVVFEAPIAPADVPALDAVLLTHIDNDHFSRPTCHDVAGVCPAYHAPQYVAEVAREEGLPGIGHDIDETFTVGSMTCYLTPAWHNWQNDSKKWAYREWKREDYCGYWLDTPDGTIWLPGDSKLLPEHLEMSAPKMILLDFSDNEWHITFEGAVKLANTYPNAQLLCIHWGTVDAPDWSTFNGDPRALAAAVANPERVLAPLPGEAVTL